MTPQLKRFVQCEFSNAATPFYDVEVFNIFVLAQHAQGCKTSPYMTTFKVWTV